MKYLVLIYCIFEVRSIPCQLPWLLNFELETRGYAKPGKQQNIFRTGKWQGRNISSEISKHKGNFIFGDVLPSKNTALQKAFSLSCSSIILFYTSFVSITYPCTLLLGCSVVANRHTEFWFSYSSGNFFVCQPLKWNKWMTAILNSFNNICWLLGIHGL